MASVVHLLAQLSASGASAPDGKQLTHPESQRCARFGSDCFSTISCIAQSVASPELPKHPKASGVDRSRAREGPEGREGRGGRGRREFPRSPQLSVSITAAARPAALDPGRGTPSMPSVP